MHKGTNEQIGYNLYKTGMLVRREAVRCCAGYGITPEQNQILMILSGIDSASQKQIGEITIQEAPTVSRILKSLAQRGLISQKREKKDRRAAKVSITPAGKALVKKIMPSLKKRFDYVLLGFEERDKKMLIKLLKKLRSVVEKAAEKHGEEIC